ncbi:MAG: hypothetical protein IT378_19915 [Sandaracinaceae bacterium]|nr:hypothetical protein [Sandaracinaceae bacterium]
MRAIYLAATSIAALALACASDPRTSADASMPENDAGTRDASGQDASGPDARDGGCDADLACGTDCCRAGERCAHGGCVIDLGPCAAHDDCPGDSYCDASMRCTPYGTPPGVTQDPECARDIRITTLAPVEQCRWLGPPAVDPFADYRQVYSSPMVADFDLDDDPSVLRPSIVITSFTYEDTGRATGGILRVLDGRTCAEQASLTDPADRLLFASQNALGDLDGDGRPEIVGTSLESTGVPRGLVAFGYDGASRRFVRRWYSRRCDLPGQPRHGPSTPVDMHNGPSLHDLDDDGTPEVLFDMFVYDAEGCLLNPSQAPARYLLGSFAVVADADGDGVPELANGAGLFEWRGGQWRPEAGFAPSTTEASRLGHTAVADFGDFPGTPAGQAEIAVVSTPDPIAGGQGAVRVQTLSGEVVFGPIVLPSDGGAGGRGGPPTIADFDGDGRPEIGVAGATRYAVFDLDCDIAAASGPGCARAAGAPRGVLWSRPVQDASSNVTGSSVFDFDADGVAEVVYGDECYVRIFDGRDGAVRFSASASSRTGYEYPVIADVDGDFNTEIVAALTEGSSSASPCPSSDPLFTDYRVSFTLQPGIVVYRDAQDRWAASRPIWNQHAYSVTHVEDDGRIPRTSAWRANHRDAALNNFRQNAQGGLEREGLADLTVALAGISELCGAPQSSVDLSARVCNRGTNPVADGARVVFYEGDPSEGATVACETSLPRLLAPSSCTEVSCTWTVPAGGDPEDVHVVVDPDLRVPDCHPGNNRGVIPRLYCDLI